MEKIVAKINTVAGLFPVQNQWSFVALTVEPNQATIYLYYLDPNTGHPELYSATQVLPEGIESFSGGTTLLGSDPCCGASRAFNGSIDEIAVFNTALTSGQLVAQFTTAAGLTGGIAPQITGQPQSVLTLGSETVTFAATGVNGTSPLYYQWQSITATVTNNLANGGNISGATNATLTINNVTTANAGSYQLVVTNTAGSTTSSVVTLDVISFVPTSYPAAIMQYGPFAYWPLNETTPNPAGGAAVAYELVNSVNGTYGVNAQDGFNGIQGPQPPEFPGFPANNTALATFANVGESYVTASAGDIVATNLTYAMWINPSGPVENWTGLLFDRGSVGEGFGFGGATDGTGMSELGYTWNQNSTWSWNSYLFPTAGQWSLVAMAIEPSRATIYLIGTNGVVQSATNAISQDSEEFGVAWHIGDDAADNNSGGRTFPGRISGVAVFLSTLSVEQVLTLYGAGIQIPPPVTLIVAPAGSGKLTLSWSQGSLLQATNLVGPWTTNSTASPATIATTNNSQTFFKVRLN